MCVLLRQVQKSCLDIALFTKYFDAGVRVQYCILTPCTLSVFVICCTVIVQSQFQIPGPRAANRIAGRR